MRKAHTANQMRVQQAGQTRKPDVMQPKKLPVAPPVYSPQLKPHAFQPKISMSPQKKAHPIGPPVYRPQPAVKLAPTKITSGQQSPAGQTARRPVAPPVYRPEAKKIVQPKASSQQRKSPAMPPVYRPQQKGIAQPEIGFRTKTLSIHRPGAQQAIARSTQASKGHRLIEAPNSRALLETSQTRLPILINGVSANVGRSSMPRNADPAKVVQRNALQKGKAKTQNVRGSQDTLKNSVVQRAREMLPYELGYVLVPDSGMEAYTQHVQMRTRHFFSVVLNAVLEMQRQGGAVGPGMFTDHAKAQEAKGYRLGAEAESKLDAAHLMNTTLVKGSFPAKTGRVKDLYRSSAATTTQFQKANVGPDKLIDSQQTQTKNFMLADINGGAVVDFKFIGKYVHDYLTSLSKVLTVQLPEDEGVLSQSRAAAMRAVLADLENIEGVLGDIKRELQ